MKAVDYLKAAWAKIDHPLKWTIYSYAKDKNGVPVLSTSDSATCFCALGALESLTPNRYDDRGEYKVAHRALSNSAYRIYGKGVPSVNDQIGYSAVEKLYAETIKDLTESEVTSE